MGMNINTTDPVTRETLARIATGDNDAIGARLNGLSKIVNEYVRLRMVAPANMVDAVDALTFALVCDDCGDDCACA
jgi:hypothetical protein